MWTCPKCGEEIEDQFDSCWKCAAPAKTTALKPLFSRTGKWCFFFGIVFELGLLLLCFLPTKSWLQSEVLNFTIITHSPLMILMEGSRLGDTMPTAILGLLIGLLIMASIWGFLIYMVIRLIKGVL